MKLNCRYVTLFTLMLILLSSLSNALFCSHLTSLTDKHSACFLESATNNPVVLRTSGNSLVLPCHVGRSKHSIVEWWYVDSQKLINIKIYPVFPAVRPTVVRFVTSLSSSLKSVNESDVVDGSILLRHVNVDDSGTYRCVIRPWTTDPMTNFQEILFNDDSDVLTLAYQVEISAPRLCQFSVGTLPCFSAMRLSSPVLIDAYQTTFLQCLINNFNRAVNVFWVVGSVSSNNVLITDYLTTNQYRGDRFRRVFPLSPFDFSIELVVNRTTPERTYSCVIDGTTDIETTLFTYIIRTLEAEEINENNSTTHRSNGSQREKKIVSHDALNREQIQFLRDNEKSKTNNDHSTDQTTIADSVTLKQSEETSTTI